MKSVLKILSFSLLFIGLNAQAQDHSHQDENFPEDALLILEGTDAVSNKECFLFVMGTGFTGPENRADQFYAEVLTSYSHDQDKAAAMRLFPQQGNSQILVGVNGKDKLALFLTSPDLDLTTATHFNAKWWHTSHFHNNRCTNLKVHVH